MSILQTFKGKLLKTMTIRGLNQIKLNLIPSFTGSNATLFNPDIFMILNTLYFDFFYYNSSYIYHVYYYFYNFYCVYFLSLSFITFLLSLLLLIFRLFKIEFPNSFKPVYV